MAVFDGVIPAIVGAANAAAGDYEIERSLRFNSGDSAYLNRTPSSAGNRKTWTWSGWVKKAGQGTQSFLFASLPSDLDNYVQIYFSSDKLYINTKTSGNAFTSIVTAGLFRDPAAWLHLVVALDTTTTGNSGKDRLKIYINGRLLGDSDYQTDGRSNIALNSDLRINSTNSHHIGKQGDYSNTFANVYLAEVNFVDGSQLAASDFGEYNDNNVWQPKDTSGLTFGTNGFRLKFDDTSTNASLGNDSSGNNNTWTVNNISGPGGDVDYASMITQQSNGGYYTNYGPEKAFDGVLTTAPNTSASNNNGNITFTPSPSISFTTSVRAYWANGNTGATYSYNGGSATSITANGWITLASGSGTFTSLNTYRGGDGQYFSAIEVDGTILLTSTGKDNDSLIDTPTNYTADSGNNGGNYCTLSPLKNQQTLSNGNLDVVGGSSWQRSVGTLGMYSGKYYWEYEITASNEHLIGVGPPDMQLGGNLGAGDPPGSGYGTELGQVNGTGANGSWSNTGGSTTGDIIGIAFDADNGNMYVYKNGSSLNGGIASHTGLVMPQIPVVSLNGSSRSGVINFGQRPFAYTPPTGYVSLCTTNLADPAIADGSTAFDNTLYSGNDTQRDITGLGFSPDMVWIKKRQSGNHSLMDTVRGATKNLVPNDTQSEGTEPQYLNAFLSDGFSLGTSGVVNDSASTYVAWAWDAGTVANPVGDIWRGSATKYIGVKFASASGGTVSFGQTSGSTTVEVWTSSDNSSWTQQGGTLTLSDGHTLTISDQYVVIRNTTNATFTNWFAAATNGADGHYSSVTYPSGASWSGPPYTDYDFRDAGGVINEDGIIPSIVHANQSAGFSIVSWTGNGSIAQTVGHGLNAAPKFIIGKSRDSSIRWPVFHITVGGGNALFLNATSTPGGGTGIWGNTNPTSSVFTIANDGEINKNGDNYIAYCFAPVEGFSAFGSYTGNGNADGPFVYIGFKPKWILFKMSSSSGDWRLMDTSRDTYNACITQLYPNNSDAESANNSAHNVDYLSNGFKVRTSHPAMNSSGQTYVWAAFAEHPLKTARAR